jgi:signal transduction histidine kinase
MDSALNTRTFYQAYRDISRLVHSSTSVKEVLEIVVWKATEVLNAKGALLRILNDNNNQFEVRAAYGLGERYLNKGSISSEKLMADQIHKNRVLIIKDILHAPRVEYPQAAWDEGIRMILDVPLTVANRMGGLLRIYLLEEREFSGEEHNFLISVAEQCGCAIQKALLIEYQQAQYEHLATHVEKMSALGRMAAGIAHEINNPLAGILLFSSNLIKKVEPINPMHEGLKIIIQESQRCKTIIQDLLEFSRDKAPQKTLVNVNTIINKALRIVENEFRLNHIQIEKSLSPALKKAWLDENQIEQVLVNILLNAVQAIQRNGTIRIKSSIDCEKRHLKVVIIDDGDGIPSDKINRIFEPFFSTKSTGTGLGLAVSYGIIHNHQGTIDVKSKEGQGTRFEICVPVPGREGE